MRKIAPLSAGFMISSMLGFILSAVFVFPTSETWGFSFCLIFVLMFVASVISMSNAPVNDPVFYRELAIHHIKNKKETQLAQENQNLLDEIDKTVGPPKPMYGLRETSVQPVKKATPVKKKAKKTAKKKKVRKK